MNGPLPLLVAKPPKEVAKPPKEVAKPPPLGGSAANGGSLLSYGCKLRNAANGVALRSCDCGCVMLSVRLEVRGRRE
jgi:hypothetical protein